MYLNKLRVRFDSRHPLTLKVLNLQGFFFLSKKPVNQQKARQDCLDGLFSSLLIRLWIENRTFADFEAVRKVLGAGLLP